MKLKIKVKVKFDSLFPEVIDKGDWVDLKLPYLAILNPCTAKGNGEIQFAYNNIPLGIAMELPKGFEAIVAPRSSTFQKYGIIQANGIGVVDNSYCSDKDEWHFPIISTKRITIFEGTRLCQFKIQLSQKATFLQKLKWLFSNGIEFIKVSSLDNEARGGFGSTGD